MLEPSWCSHTPTCECLSFPPDYFTLCPMSDYSVNLSNESPPRSATATPIVVDQPESATSADLSSSRQAIPPPISPQTAINVLAQDIPAERARDIARSLVTTIQHRDTIHCLEADTLCYGPRSRRVQRGVITPVEVTLFQVRFDGLYDST